ncbi:MAG: DUF4886 domain-containing protein [Hyphomicrobiaceae bacterium]
MLNSAIMHARSPLRTIVAALSGLLFLAHATPGAATEPRVTHLEPASPGRILFVGNSYLYYNDSLHNHVRRMVIAAGLHAAKDVQFKSVTISGGALFDHDIRHYLKPGQLRVKNGFQIVVLQGASAAPFSEGRRKKFLETVKSFATDIKAAGAQTALYMTHAYAKPHAKARAGLIDPIASMYVEAGNTVGALVIPVGLAFDEAYRQRPGIKLHQSFDGSHPSLDGTYLAACVVFTSLYGTPSSGNPYDYFGRIDKDTARFLQNVADKTVARFFKRK